MDSVRSALLDAWRSSRGSKAVIVLGVVMIPLFLAGALIAALNTGSSREDSPLPTSRSRTQTQPTATLTPAPAATVPPTTTPAPPTATDQPPPSATPVPPTATAVPPTDIPIPPTATAAPPTAIPVPTQTPAPVGAAANTNAKLRAGPGTDYTQIGSAAAGDSLQIVARTDAGDWYQLVGGAWVFGELVDNAPIVPVAAVIPTVAPVVAAPAVEPTLAAVQPLPTVPAAPARVCCKICRSGKACGDTCISASKTCHVGLGCACDG